MERSAEKAISSASEQEKQSDQLNSDSSQTSYTPLQTCNNDEEKASSLELPNSSQKTHGHDTGSSFSTVPLNGDLVGQSDGRDEDLSAVYMQGISLSRNQPPPFRVENVPPNSDTDVTMSSDQSTQFNSYNLPSLPIDLQYLPPVLLSSTLIGSSQIPAPFGIGDSTMNNVMIHGSTLPVRSQGTQGVPNLADAPGMIINQQGSGGSSSNLIFGSASNMSGSNSYYDGQGPSILRHKRKMTLESEANINVPNYRRWNSSLVGGQSSSSTSNERFALYDPRYEQSGEAVDPHLRIFNATTGNGNGRPG